MRSNIKHVSFGLWGTLIKTNPKFKAERLRYLSEVTDKHTSVIETTMHQVANSKTSVYNKYNSVLEVLGCKMGGKDIHRIYLDIEDICMRYLPDIYDRDTFNVLYHLHKTKDVGIISNNTFFTPETTRRILERLGILDLTDSVILSEEAKCSKPDREIFDLWVSSTTKSNKVYIDSYLHVGCNKEKDYATPSSLGMHSFLINGTTLRGIKSINEYIKTYAH